MWAITNSDGELMARRTEYGHPNCYIVQVFLSEDEAARELKRLIRNSDDYNECVVRRVAISLE